MANKRELELIEKGTPCYVNYFDKDLLTVEQAKQALEDKSYICLNIKPCETTGIGCTLRAGLQMAGYVQKGSDLKKELMKVSEADFIDKEFWNSTDGKEVTRIKGKSNVLRAVEYFARVVLLQDTSESVLRECKECGGVKLEEKVHDSVWFRNGGPGPCAGTGGTRSRTVEYCPNCEQKPVGGIIYQEDTDKE